MGDFTNSFDFDVTKNSVIEGFTITAAALEDAAAHGGKPTSNERIQSGDVLLDTYKVESDAISGGMGSVWRVLHTGWGAELAMKRPQPRFFAEASEARKAEFVAECENWIGMGLHPNIVSCYYVREIGGVPTVFSEWMGAGSLKDAIASGALYEGSAPEIQERILDVAIQSARGLAHAHALGRVHQDVKPGNLLLSEGWEAKVADFGLARAISQVASAGADADAGIGDGATRPTGYTPAYCPREQAAGEPPAPWMDVYAWALTVLEMYAGGRSWEAGADAAGIYGAVFDEARVGAPAAVRELVGRCLAEHVDGFEGVLPALEGVYRDVVGDNYPRIDSGEATRTADMLNNFALSFFDLGKQAEAQSLWNRALEQTPDHPAALYNTSLYDWRRGVIDDEELMVRLAAIKPKENSQGLENRWLAQINGERGARGTRPFADMSDAQSINELGSAMTMEGGRGIGSYKPHVAISADGARIFVGTYEIQCLDAATLECLYRVHAGGLHITEMHLSPDGRYLLFAGTGGDGELNLHVLEAESGKDAGQAGPFPTRITRFCIDPDSRHCYVGCGINMANKAAEPPKALVQCDFIDAVSTWRDSGFAEAITGLSIAPDGSILYAASGHTLYTLDAATGAVIRSDDTPLLSELVLSPDGTQLFVGYMGSKLAIYHTDTCAWEIQEGTGMSNPLWISPDGSRLFTSKLSGGHGRIQLWNVADRRCIRTWFAHLDYIIDFAASDDGTLFATASDDYQVRLWKDLPKKQASWEVCRIRSFKETLERQRKLDQLEHALQAALETQDLAGAIALVEQAEALAEMQEGLRFFPYRQELSRLCLRGKLEDAYEVSGFEDQEDRTVQCPACGVGGSIAFGSSTVCINEEHEVLLDTGQPGGARLLTYARSMGTTPDKKTLFLVDDEVDVWDTSTWEKTYAFRPSRGMVIKTCLRVSPDGRLLALATSTYTDDVSEIRLWSLPSMERICEQQLTIGYVCDVAFSADCCILFVHGEQGLAQVALKWELHAEGPGGEGDEQLLQIQAQPGVGEVQGASDQPSADGPCFMGAAPLLSVDVMRAGEPISFSADGMRFLCGEDLYSVPDGALISPDARGGEAHACVLSALSSNGTFYLRSTEQGDGFLKIDAMTKEVLAACDDQRETLVSLVITPDDQLMISGFATKMVDLWHADGNYKGSTFNMNPIEDLVVSNDSVWIFCCGARGISRIKTNKSLGGGMPLSQYVHMSLSHDDAQYLLSEGSAGLRLVGVEHSSQEEAVSSASNMAFFLPGDQEILCSYGNAVKLLARGAGGAFAEVGCLELPDEVLRICVQGNGWLIAAATGAKAYVWECPAVDSDVAQEGNAAQSAAAEQERREAQARVEQGRRETEARIAQIDSLISAKQRELEGLGLFKGAEKKRLRAEIEELERERAGLKM